MLHRKFGNEYRENNYALGAVMYMMTYSAFIFHVVICLKISFYFSLV